MRDREVAEGQIASRPGPHRAWPRKILTIWLAQVLFWLFARQVNDGELEGDETAPVSANETAADAGRMDPPALEPMTSPPPVNETPPLAPPPLASAPPGGPTPEPFAFHGEATEFFRIWIVNTLLTLVTGGLFLAWAKVRKRRYLRGSTELMGHRFDYRADPRRILIGNIIVFVFFVGYALFGAVYPIVHAAVIVIAAVVLPWVVVRSLTFNAHNTVYRGMRFRFNPSVSASALVYLLKPMLLLVTFGLYYPAWARAKRQYIVSKHRLGDAYFHFDADTGPYYAAYVIGGLMVFGVFLVGSVAIGVITAMGGTPPMGPAWTVPFFAVYGLMLFISRQYIFARLFNHVWNHTRLDEHRFSAKMVLGTWMKLQLTNLAAIVGTAGLMYPWALIRSQRYLASSLCFIPAGPVEKIESLGGKQGSGVGESAAEFIGLDFGL